MADKTADELRAERRALDAQIAEAEGREPPPLKMSDLARMDDAEIAENAARVKSAVRDAARRHPRDEDRITPAGRTARLNRAFESSDPKARREERQEGRGARAGLEGADDE